MSVVYLSKDIVDNMTLKDLKKLISMYMGNKRYSQLESYYIGNHDILNHSPKDPTLPNNRIVNNMCKHITDIATGFFIGKPVIYSSTNEELISTLQEIYDYNDEQDENAELAKQASINGHCYEMLYMDEDANIRFCYVAPKDCLMIYQQGYREPLAVIRKVESVDLYGKTSFLVEYWTHSEVYRYSGRKLNDLSLLETEYHFWGDVPFIEFVNNTERLGDFEGIISQNDAYNKVQSNTANLFQYNDEAILKISALGDVSTSDIRSMKEKGAIVLEDDGEIDWLTKNINDEATENYKNRLSSDVHHLSSTPNLSDENFGNNASGVAMDYKLWGLEQIRGNKERKFKKGLQRRAELITRMLNLTGHRFNYLELKMLFRQNKPQNLLELSQIINQLNSTVSHETLLTLLPFIDDVQSELNLLAQEKQKDVQSFGSYNAILSSLEEYKNNSNDSEEDSEEHEHSGGEEPPH